MNPSTSKPVFYLYISSLISLGLGLTGVNWQWPEMLTMILMILGFILFFVAALWRPHWLAIIPALALTLASYIIVNLTAGVVRELVIFAMLNSLATVALLGLVIYKALSRPKPVSTL